MKSGTGQIQDIRSMLTGMVAEAAMEKSMDVVRATVKDMVMAVVKVMAKDIVMVVVVKVMAKAVDMETMEETMETMEETMIIIKKTPDCILTNRDRGWCS